MMLSFVSVMTGVVSDAEDDDVGDDRFTSAAAAAAEDAHFDFSALIFSSSAFSVRSDAAN